MHHPIRMHSASADVNSAELSALDWPTVEGLRSIQGGELYSTLVDLFRVSSANAMSQLKVALDQSDAAPARAICHKLAAAAANVGAVAFGKEVRRLELLCDTKPCGLGVDGEARRVFEGLALAHPRLSDELLTVQLRASA